VAARARPSGGGPTSQPEPNGATRGTGARKVADSGASKANVQRWTAWRLTRLFCSCSKPMTTLPATITPRWHGASNLADRPAVPYARNARTHSAEQIAQIAASILEFGFTNPILVDSMTDHCRPRSSLAAASWASRRCRWWYWTPQRDAAAAYILADNKLAMNAGWTRNARQRTARTEQTAQTSHSLLQRRGTGALLEDGDAPSEDVTTRFPNRQPSR